MVGWKTSQKNVVKVAVKATLQRVM